MGIVMIKREDILSMNYLERSEYTGSHQGMRYRLEKEETEDGDKKLKCTIWPEPFNFFNTPDTEKQTELFLFEEDGVVDAVAWMNDRLFQEKSKWDHASKRWEEYQ